MESRLTISAYVVNKKKWTEFWEYFDWLNIDCNYVQQRLVRLDSMNESCILGLLRRY